MKKAEFTVYSEVFSKEIDKLTEEQFTEFYRWWNKHCPKCASKNKIYGHPLIDNSKTTYICGSRISGSYFSGRFEESHQCTKNQLEQLTQFLTGVLT